MKKLLELIEQRPVLFYAVIQAFITALTTFGLHLSPEQTGSILILTSTILTFITQQQVTPNSTVDKRVEVALNTPVPTAPTGDDNGPK